ncbi:hypothetical protein [Phenylobacterium sp.]|jgi:hypothetical protein|uniref:hypothetical protein n=1 Tax=Phenylobacterium sp. TaxID=1871053 RepID=UPI00378428DF
MTALTFGGVAKSAAKTVSGLPKEAKGKIGERLSDGRTLLSGDWPKLHGKKFKLDGDGHTFADHQTARGKVVEAKLGPTARLSDRQRQAQAELGKRYRYDHWSFDDVGRLAGGAAVGLQQGIGHVADGVQDALRGRKPG